MTKRKFNWRRYRKAIVAAFFSALAAANTALLTNAPPYAVVVAALLAIGTTFGVYQVANDTR